MGTNHSSTSSASAARFPNTRWSLWQDAIQTNSPAAEEALEQLCQAYWYPLYAFARRKGHSADNAKDLTQSFFHDLLAKNWLADANRERGKLRTFLLTLFQRFMAREWRSEQTQRRGGKVTFLSLDIDEAEQRYASAATTPSAEELFDRQWALTLMQQTLNTLKEQLEQQDRETQFDTLQPTLMAERGDLNYPQLAQELQTTPQAARVAVHRFRKSFRELFRHQVQQTLSEEDHLEHEMQKLAQALQ